MSILYDLAFCIFSVLYFPYVLLKGKWHEDFSMRFGNVPEGIKEKLRKKDNIWVHAVSVGEVLSVARLIENIKAVFPVHQIVLTVVTKTGYTLAQSRFPNDVVMYAPLDFSLFVRRYIRFISPKIYITAETELWPNLFLALQKNKVPVVVANGRISKSAFDGYKAVNVFMKGILSNVDAFCMQTERYARRIKKLGAKEERVHVVGNIKFDDLPSAEALSYKDLGIREGSPVFIAGSTHLGEEEIILNIYQSLLGSFPDLRLVIAPRHVERVEEVVGLVKQRNFSAARFSQVKNHPADKKAVIVVDTIGHLKSLYRLATLVFVGKSLTVGGGHNIIEPAFFAKAVLIGPHMENFQDVTSLFLDEKAVIQVADADELKEKITYLLSHPQDRESIGRLAHNVVEKYTGATVRTAKIITHVMAQTR